MRASFVIGLGICVVAGFNSQLLRTYEPYKDDGISMVGEPDWELTENTAEEAAAQTAADGADGENGTETDAETAAETAAPENGGEETETGSGEAEEAGGEWVSLGDDWVITYYCPLECCNDQWAWQTSTQSPMQLHHTIAVDPSVIPYYTHVRIGGLDYEYVAEDCGGGIKGKRIDVLVDNCDLANELGVDRNVEVWVRQ